MLLSMGEMTQGIRPEELLDMIRTALRQETDGVLTGRVASDGRGAAVNLLLPNGQTFRLSVEELT